MKKIRILPKGSSKTYVTKTYNVIKLACLFLFIGQLNLLATNSKIQNLAGNQEKINENQSQNEKNITITGQVTDQKGLPIPGVNIYEETNPSNGVISDMNGNYSIRVKSKKSIITYSFIGHQIQKIQVLEKTIINLTLVEEYINLDEVVAIGYGVTTKRDLTGSVASLKADNIENTVINNVAEALSGKLAGVQVSTPDGAPGGGVNIQIRGINSINGSSEPLYVVDNFIGVDPSSIDPSEITNIEVLKDASASAIYGSLGANGVIIITTSNLSKKTKSAINFSATYGINQVIKKFDVLDGGEYYQMLKLKVPDYELFNEWAEKYKNEKGINWQDEALRKACYQTYNFSANGTSGDTKYYTSFSYTNQDGVLINTGYKKFTATMRGENQFNKIIKLKTGFNYSNEKQSGLTQSGRYGAYYSLLYQRPHFGDQDLKNTDIFYEPDGTPIDGGINPIKNLQNVNRNNLKQTFRGDIEVSFRILPSLSFVTKLANSWIFEDLDEFKGLSTIDGSFKKGIATLGKTKTTRLINDNLLNFEPKISVDHKVKAMVGFSQQELNQEYIKNQSSGFENEVLGPWGLPNGNDTKLPDVDKSKWALNSFIGRINYSYKDKYLLTTTFRADGSSKFGSGNKWGYFPSLSFGWRIGEEKIVKQIKSISNLKLRTSYGLNGNQGIPCYASLSRYSSANYTLDNGLTIGIAPSSIPNEKLKWEKTKQLDIGLELGLFNNRISTTFDYYHKKTEDLLLNVSIPATTGFDEMLMNFGSLKNEGIELAVNLIAIRKKDFQWDINFNISKNKNKIVKLSDENSYKLLDPTWDDRIQDEFILKEGYPIGSMYGYVFDGLYQLNDFLYDNQEGPYELKGNIPQMAGKTTYNPGDVKYKDINGDGVVNASDRTIIGNSTPELFGGFGSSFTYKNFTLNAFFTWQYNADILNGNRLYMERLAGRNNNFKSVLDYWTLDNQNTNIPAPGIEAAGPWVMSNRYIEDASFVRLKTLSLKYNLPKKLLKTGKFKSLSVEFAAKNLLTFTGYDGTDPEATAVGNILSKGIDFGTYPMPRTYVMSLKASF